MRTRDLPRLVAFCLLAAGCEPLLMIPGGELSGTEQAIPAEWSFTDAVDTVVLETRPDDPYSVNVWGVGVGDRFFIAGDTNNSWAQHLRDDPRVRLKVGDDLYVLAATRTDDPSDLKAFLEAARKKYDFEPSPEQRARASLFVLGPR